VFNPVKCPIYEISEHEIFDNNHLHLEYFPIVNQRIFPIGQLDKGDTEKDKGEEGYKKILN